MGLQVGSPKRPAGGLRAKPNGKLYKVLFLQSDPQSRFESTLKRPKLSILKTICTLMVIFTFAEVSWDDLEVFVLTRDRCAVPGAQTLCGWEWDVQSLPVLVVWAFISSLRKTAKVPGFSCPSLHLFPGSVVNKASHLQQTPSTVMGSNVDLCLWVYHSKPGHSAWCPGLSPKSLATQERGRGLALQPP